MHSAGWSTVALDLVHNEVPLETQILEPMIENFLFATGLAFQIPAIQVVLGLFGIVSGEKMLSAWKYVIVICTIVAAIITPSTDPITQILLSVALLSLYLGGSGFVILLKKKVL